MHVSLESIRKPSSITEISKKFTYHMWKSNFNAAMILLTKKYGKWSASCEYANIL